MKFFNFKIFNKFFFQLIGDLRGLILRVTLAEKEVEELIQKSIVTNEVNKLFEVINEATAEIAVMRLELNDMTEKLQSQKDTYKYERLAKTSPKKSL